MLKSSIPAALSFKLIGAAINVWPLKVRQEGVCLYHQAAILCIDGSNELHISVKDNKIIIYLINKDTKHFIKGQTFIAAPINLKDKAAGMDDFKSL
jgi:hypothetical protein